MDKDIEFLIYFISEEIKYRKQALREGMFSLSEYEGIEEDIRLLKSSLEKVTQKFI